MSAHSGVLLRQGSDVRGACGCDWRASRARVTRPAALQDVHDHAHSQRPAMGILGPCPGCDGWQVEYPADVTPAELEAVCREHAVECEGLLQLAIAQVRAL